jgi:hypothetical protein
MSWFCSFALTSYVILLGVAFQSVPSSAHPANEDFRSQTVPDWQLQKLTLVNLGETYETISSTKTAEGRSHVQLTLKVGIRLQNISGNHVLAVGTDCFRLVKTLVIPEPLVGPVEEPGGVLTTPWNPVEHCKNLGLPRQFLKVMPGESYTVTEQLKFVVLNDAPADLPQSLNPGVYYLRATIEMARSWDLDKPNKSVNWFVSTTDTAPMKFTVTAKRQT